MTLGPARTLNLLTSARPLLPGEVILTGPTHHRLTRGRCPANILSSYGGEPTPKGRLQQSARTGRDGVPALLGQTPERSVPAPTIRAVAIIRDAACQGVLAAHPAMTRHLTQRVPGSRLGSFPENIQGTQTVPGKGRK